MGLLDYDKFPTPNAQSPMPHPQFQVIFIFDSEYQGYVAEVPELPGCVSQGKTLNKAVENIKDAIKGYLYVERKHSKANQSINNKKLPRRLG